MISLTDIDCLANRWGGSLDIVNALIMANDVI